VKFHFKAYQSVSEGLRVWIIGIGFHIATETIARRQAEALGKGQEPKAPGDVSRDGSACVRLSDSLVRVKMRQGQHSLASRLSERSDRPVKKVKATI
jgi:hypothetical protein